MLKVWGRRNAYNVQKVLWTIGELNLPYEHVDVGSIPGQLDTPEFRAINPHCRIPVIADGEMVIWESNTIVRYLSATYGKGMLWLDSPAARSFAERWMDWELATLQDDFLGLFWNFFRTPEDQQDHAIIKNYRSRCEQHYSKLDNHLAKQPYLAGTTFTMGDIACATSLYRYFEMGIPTPSLPNLNIWHQRLSERQAYRDHIMTPFEELRGRVIF